MPKKEETFVLVSLEESKAKELAQVISNDTCRKILDHLAKGKATETEIANKLNIPLSTVHYNMNALLKAGLVEAEEFHYSEKGREVNHYSLAHKYVIIVPSSLSSGIKDKLKSLLLSLGVVGIVGGVVHVLTRITTPTSFSAVSHLEKKALAAGFADVASEAFSAPVAQIKEGYYPVVTYAWYDALVQSKLFWVLVGAVALVVVYIIVELARKKMKR